MAAAAGAARSDGIPGSAFMMLTGGIDAAEGKNTFGPGGRTAAGRAEACAVAPFAGTGGAAPDAALPARKVAGGAAAGGGITAAGAGVAAAIVGSALAAGDFAIGGQPAA